LLVAALASLLLLVGVFAFAQASQFGTTSELAHLELQC
jgi:hypothetical protein